MTAGDEVRHLSRPLLGHSSVRPALTSGSCPPSPQIRQVQQLLAKLDDAESAQLRTLLTRLAQDRSRH